MDQENSSRKRFGLLISHLASDYALKRCQGVERAAKEANIDIVIFPGTLMQDFLGSNKDVSFTFTHNIIFEYAAKFQLDALIICIAGIADYYDQHEFEFFLKRFSGIPVILMETRIPGYRSLVTDNRDGIRAILEHLIGEHHYRKICYVSGPDNNYDAQVRKQAYREVMESHGLSVTPEMMVNGWFSSRCQDAISRLLDDNPGIEAICCANDLMAACACGELTRRGLVPGRDVAVTGFDDADLARIQDPPLTTYRVNSFQLGYHAVYEALHLLRGEAQQVDCVGGDLVLRSSCGCGYRVGWGAFLDRFLPLSPFNVAAVTEQVLVHTLRSPVADARTVCSYPPLLELLSSLLAYAVSGQPAEAIPPAGCVQKLQDLCGAELSTENLQNALDVFLEKLCLQVSDPDRKNFLLKFRIRLRQSLFDLLLREHQISGERSQEQIWIATALMQGALFHSRCSPGALREICYRLKELGMQSAYLYTYPEAIPVKRDGDWRCAEQMSLSAYLKRETVIVPEKGILLDNRDLMQRLSAVQGRRYTMLAFCLITEEEQQGFFLCESDLSRYFIAYVASMQIGAALKFFSLLEQRTAMEYELKTALETISRKNEMLQLLSTKDDLTKCLNRRGFLERMQSQILKSLGKRSALCLLDLDNLKSINDCFGHKEGDYALSSFVRLVQSVTGEEDIFGRYGGDEFILLIPEISQLRLKALPEQLRQAFKSFNSASRKPYYIEASFGLLPFVCTEESSMETLLADVDKLLYRDKRRKKHRTAVREPHAAV